MVKKLLSIIFLGALLFAGIIHAGANDLPDPGMLPDRPLYFLKSLWENVATLLTFGEISRAERFLTLAERRMAEARVLANEGKSEFVQRTLSRRQEQFVRALGAAEQARQKGLDTDEVLAKVSEATLRHQAVLIEVYEKVPEQARPAIERAMEQSMKGHEQALEAVSKEKREQVKKEAEIRMQEAFQKAEQARGRGVTIPRILPQPSLEFPVGIIEEEIPSGLPIEIFEPEIPSEIPGSYQ